MSDHIWKKTELALVQIFVGTMRLFQVWGWNAEIDGKFAMSFFFQFAERSPCQSPSRITGIETRFASVSWTTSMPTVSNGTTWHATTGNQPSVNSNSFWEQQNSDFDSHYLWKPPKSIKKYSFLNHKLMETSRNEKIKRFNLLKYKYLCIIGTNVIGSIN